MASPELEDLMSGDPQRVANAFHVIASEIESGCILVARMESSTGPRDRTGFRMGYDEWTFTLIPTRQHEDDIFGGGG